MTKPTAGYRSQSQAVESMFVQGMSHLDIVKATGVARANVDTIISKYRKRIGMQAPEGAGGAADYLWDLPPGVLRQRIAERASQGARQTLEAAGL